MSTLALYKDRPFVIRETEGDVVLLEPYWMHTPDRLRIRLGHPELEIDPPWCQVEHALERLEHDQAARSLDVEEP